MHELRHELQEAGTVPDVFTTVSRAGGTLTDDASHPPHSGVVDLPPTSYLQLAVFYKKKVFNTLTLNANANQHKGRYFGSKIALKPKNKK